MTRHREDLYDCEDMIQSCVFSSESNFAKFVCYAEIIEELRLKIIAPYNDEYRILKSWLHTAYGDIINSKFEHIDLIRLYEVLLNKNHVQEFYDYVNDRKTLQLKFIQMMNESKNFEIRLNAVKEDIASLKTKYMNDDETLRLKFADIIGECKSLKSSLDSAYEEIILSSMEYDILSKNYQKLLKEKTVKEFLDCAKHLENLRLEFNPASSECHCSTESWLDQTNEAIASLQSELKEIRKILNGKRFKSEKVKKERDSLNFVLEKLSHLLSKIPQPVKINQEGRLLDESIQNSANESDSGITGRNDEFIFVGVDLPDPPEEKCMSKEEIYEQDSVIEDQVSSERMNELNSQSETTECPISSAKLNKSSSKKRQRTNKIPSRLSVLCEKCGKSFRVKNDGQTPLKCPSCAGPPKPLYAHCDICGRDYSQKVSLIYHIRRIHEGKKPYQCAICGKQFNVKCNLTIHELTHGSEKPYKCSICNRCFRHPSNLKRHTKIVHEKTTPFCCAHCGKKCGVKTELLYHIHTNHFSGTLKQFKCFICDKSFAYKHDLTRHQRLHSSL